MTTSKPTVSIVGFGRFGRVLHRLLKDDFSVIIYDIKTVPGVTTCNLSDVYSADGIFYAVPIAAFDQVISTHQKYFQDRHLLIDVLSVKLHPAQVFTKYLKGSSTQALLTHPMFGPDSAKDSFIGLPIVMDKFLASDQNYQFWTSFFIQKQLRVAELSARKHDRLAASSQGLTHFVGRLLDSYGLKPTPIDTLGAKKLLEVVDQTCHDTHQLFANLQHFNPYTQGMRLKLGTKYDRLYSDLLPRQVRPDMLTFGIQGGKGSFNEEALHYFLHRSGIAKYQIKYLYTSENVLKALHRGKIDRGQFAIHNSVGGIVDESIHAMANYKFRIIDQYAIEIAHALMIRPDARLPNITTIMTHPQVLAQCRRTLSEKYPGLKLTSGTGQLIDHALVAKHLSQGKLPKHIATMGSKVLADLYNLTVIETDLQDAKANFTSFLQVAR